MQEVRLPAEADSFADKLMNIDKDRVEAVVKKIQAFDPAGAQKVGLATLSEIAHISILLHANPLPSAGELWYWVDHRGRPVIYIGYAYYNRISRMYDPIGFLYDEYGAPENGRPMTQEERQHHGLKGMDIGCVSHGFRIRAVKELTEMGFDAETASKMAARMGIGIVREKQMFYQKDSGYHKKGDAVEPPNGRSWAWVAMKRSLVALFRELGITHPLVQQMLDYTDDQWDDHYDESTPDEIMETRNIIDAETHGMTEAERMVWESADNFVPALCLEHYKAEAHARGTIRELFTLGEKSIPKGNLLEDKRKRVTLLNAVLEFHHMASQQSFTYAKNEWLEIDHNPCVRAVIGKKPSVLLEEMRAEMKAKRSS